MRYSTLFSAVLMFFSNVVSAEWHKINDVDYIWGPFKIYNLSLFSETGEYTPDTRPLMLTLKYAKPVDGRDFAISLARSWSNLGITLPEQESVVDRLRKTIPDIKIDDSLSYIALEDKGYFVLNDVVIPEEFNQDFNDAVLAIWLDPRVEIGRKLLNRPMEQSVIHDSETKPVITEEGTKTENPIATPEPSTSETTGEASFATAKQDQGSTVEKKPEVSTKDVEHNVETSKEKENDTPLIPEQKERELPEPLEESKEVLPPSDPIPPLKRPAT